MRLSLYTMRKTVYEGETTRVTLPTVMGEVTILDNHEPYVTMLSPGKINYEANKVVGPNTIQEEGQLSVKGGFVEVRPGNELRILADE